MCSIRLTKETARPHGTAWLRPQRPTLETRGETDITLAKEVWIHPNYRRLVSEGTREEEKAL